MPHHLYFQSALFNTDCFKAALQGQTENNNSQMQTEFILTIQ